LEAFWDKQFSALDPNAQSPDLDQLCPNLNPSPVNTPRTLSGRSTDGPRTLKSAPTGSSETLAWFAQTVDPPPPLDSRRGASSLAKTRSPAHRQGSLDKAGLAVLVVDHPWIVLEEL
jgi:hypothetical protein